MKLALHHLVEEHFKPKWWQFFRKQKYHVCNKGLDWQIFEVSPKKCVMSHAHHSGSLASVGPTSVAPRCNDNCPQILASDPKFFEQLDQYLARRCFDICYDRDEKNAYATSAAPSYMSPGPSPSKW